MATPTYNSAGNGAAIATTGNLSVPWPASVPSGKLAVLQATVRNATSTISTPSGWTLMYGPDNGGSTVTVRQYLFRLNTLTTGSESGNVALSYGSDAGVTKTGRIYLFDDVDTASSFEAGANTVGTSNSISMPSVAAGGNNRLAVACLFVSDDNAVASATGESGGDWTEAVAEFTTQLGSDGCIQLQTADLSSGGTISGGATSMGASDPWGVRAFALVGAAIQPSGTIDQTLAVITPAASGTVASIGTVAQTLANLTAEASGWLLVTGTISQTLADLVASASGTVEDPSPSGSIAVTLDSIIPSASGGIYAEATVSQTFAPISAAASGQVASLGSVAVSLADVAVNAVGALLSSGAVAQTLADIQADITGAVGNVVVGTVSVTLDPMTAAATGIVSVSGTISGTLQPIIPAVDGFAHPMPVSGTIDVLLASLTVSATGLVGVGLDLPMDRTLTVAAEIRILSVDPETRTLSVQAESRTFVPDGGDVQ